MVDDLWLDYLEKQRQADEALEFACFCKVETDRIVKEEIEQMDEALKLMRFWAQEAVQAVEETAKYTDETVRNVRAYLRREASEKIPLFLWFSQVV